MLSSRKIDDLILPAKIRALNFIHECKMVGIDLLVTCTRRDAEAQAALYAQGRTAEQLASAGLLIDPRPGSIVTHARPGESFHEYGVALDVVPLRYGKPVWSTAGNGIDDDPSDDDTDDLELWQRVGRIGEACGLEWAGRWTRFREFPHFQFTGGLSIAELKEGKTIPASLNIPRRVA